MSGLPAGWTEAFLAELGGEIRGSVVAATGVSYELYSVPTFPTRRPEILDGSEIGSAKRPVQPGDVLLCKINPRINRVWIVAEPFGHQREQVASTEYLVLRTSDFDLSRYIMWYLRSPAFREWIKLTVEGATGSHTRAKSGPILRQRIPVPPMNEQRRIVAAIEEQFSRLDAADTSLSSAQGRLALLRGQAVELAFIGDWSWTTLGEIAEIAGGVTKDAKREGDPSFVEVPYLRVANVQRGFLDLAEVSMIRVSPEKAKALALQPGDVLFNEGGDRDKLGRGWVWSGEVEGCIHQNHVFRARLHDEFEPKFVSWHGNMFGRGWFQANGRQTTNLASLNLNTLKRFPVPAPPLEEQRRIVTEVEQQLSLIDAMHRSIEAAKRRSAALRRSILERAFRGELVPQDPTDEPASVLLQRIAAGRATAGEATGRRPRRRATMQRS